MGPSAHILPGGTRLHLQHGPIDLIIGAEGERQKAFEAAMSCFDTILATLVGELPALRVPLTPATPRPTGPVARRMHDACLPLCQTVFVTRMAAVAGSVADAVLHAMVGAADLSRAYVNNGGDIALHLAPGAQYTTAMQGHDGQTLGRLVITAQDSVRGIATSGRHGRSLSLGIADSVTVLAGSAAQADVAATLIANAVDVPGHPAITRRAAQDIDDDTDLGAQPTVVACGALSSADRQTALEAGYARASAMRARGLITDAALFLQGDVRATPTPMLHTQNPELLDA